MNEKLSALQRFGGIKKVIFFTIAFAVLIGYQGWERSGGGSAMNAVASELGLNVAQDGRRFELRGRIDDIDVIVDTTTERVTATSNVRYYTRFRLFSADSPPGTIVGASLRQRILGAMKDTETTATGDPALDKALFVTGPVAPQLALLDAQARAAIIAATNAGWALNRSTWEALESGVLTNADTMRKVLELGLAAARAAAIAGAQTPEPAPRSAQEYATELGIDDPDTAFAKAYAKALAGDYDQLTRNALISGVLNPTQQARAIEAMGKMGGGIEAAVLGGVKGEHEAAARAAIEAIRARQR